MHKIGLVSGKIYVMMLFMGYNKQFFLKNTENMKLKSLSILGMALSVMGFAMSSCNDDDSSVAYLYPDALVTVKHAPDKVVYLQLDEQTTLLPENLSKSPFGDKEVRALVSFSDQEGDSKGYTKLVHVNWMDSIRTKDMVMTLDDQNDAVYGTDMLEVVKDWVTVVEDGYLTLRFRTEWGGMHVFHDINLVGGVNADNPYELELRHNAHGDTQGQVGDGLIAFKLTSLPDTDGETVKLKLKWNSYSGPKSVEFDYCTSKAAGAPAIDLRNLKLAKTIQ